MSLTNENVPKLRYSNLEGNDNLTLISLPHLL